MFGRLLLLAAGILNFLAAGAVAQESVHNLPRPGLWNLRLVTVSQQQLTGAMTIRRATGGDLIGQIRWNIDGGDAVEEIRGTVDGDSRVTLHARFVDDEDPASGKTDDTLYGYDPFDAGEYSAIVCAGGAVLRRGKWLEEGSTGGYWSAKWAGPSKKK